MFLSEEPLSAGSTEVPHGGTGAPVTSEPLNFSPATSTELTLDLHTRRPGPGFLVTLSIQVSEI